MLTCVSSNKEEEADVDQWELRLKIRAGWMTQALMLASHLDQKTFSNVRVCVGESASRGMCLWLGTPLPWWSAIWGDVTVGADKRGLRSRTTMCWKEHGGGAAVNARSVAHLYIPPHTHAHRQHVCTHVDVYEAYQWKTYRGRDWTMEELNNEDRMAKNHQNHDVTYHPDWMQQCFKMQEIINTNREAHWAVSTHEVMQMTVRGTVHSSTRGPHTTLGEP